MMEPPKLLLGDRALLRLLTEVARHEQGRGDLVEHGCGSDRCEQQGANPRAYRGATPPSPVTLRQEEQRRERTDGEGGSRVQRCIGDRERSEREDARLPAARPGRQREHDDARRQRESELPGIGGGRDGTVEHVRGEQAEPGRDPERAFAEVGASPQQGSRTGEDEDEKQRVDLQVLRGRRAVERLLERGERDSPGRGHDESDREGDATAEAAQGGEPHRCSRQADERADRCERDRRAHRREEGQEARHEGGERVRAAASPCREGRPGPPGPRSPRRRRAESGGGCHGCCPSTAESGGPLAGPGPASGPGPPRADRRRTSSAMVRTWSRSRRQSGTSRTSRK